jgi:hypothetical protein
MTNRSPDRARMRDRARGHVLDRWRVSKLPCQPRDFNSIPGTGLADQERHALVAKHYTLSRSSEEDP